MTLVHRIVTERVTIELTSGGDGLRLELDAAVSAPVTASQLFDLANKAGEAEAAEGRAGS